MTVQVILPAILSPFAERQTRVEVGARTIGELFEQLARRHPALRPHILGEDGQPRRYFNIYLNDEDVRFLANGKTPLEDADVVSFIPSVSGG